MLMVINLTGIIINILSVTVQIGRNCWLLQFHLHGLAGSVWQPC